MISPLEAIAEIIDRSPGNSRDKAAEILFSLVVESGLDPEQEANEYIRAEMAEEEAACLRCELKEAREMVISCQEGCADMMRVYLALSKRLVLLRPGDGQNFDEIAEGLPVLAKTIEENKAAFRREYGVDPKGIE